mmetsp:Transcript_6072/g.14838  ORF Transcript_6072/g.14838 Transcript_6072/m.14838 type:complete len:872 (-) Transcript_6072:237-2852(-)|eukprot:CAMPEP_0113895742 /NCGR_PEP_ID=MMETSP0780_2-20120614/17558_1 /TAXON_ID=652834 /ORGANISM="Palpitomonas bilix" /LENGTH=871 /DNA_ID=CAMNT_0000886659 /DNA_START=135 /DNA_END=2750 /DNA_ORIENTATION=- /assembly_acc=CAM_ASM_000599
MRSSQNPSSFSSSSSTSGDVVGVFPVHPVLLQRLYEGCRSLLYRSLSANEIHPDVLNVANERTHTTELVEKLLFPFCVHDWEEAHLRLHPLYVHALRHLTHPLETHTWGKEALDLLSFPKIPYRSLLQILQLPSHPVSRHLALQSEVDFFNEMDGEESAPKTKQTHRGLHGVSRLPFEPSVMGIPPFVIKRTDSISFFPSRYTDFRSTKSQTARLGSDAEAKLKLKPQSETEWEPEWEPEPEAELRVARTEENSSSREFRNGGVVDLAVLQEDLDHTFVVDVLVRDLFLQCVDLQAVHRLPLPLVCAFYRQLNEWVAPKLRSLDPSRLPIVLEGAVEEDWNFFLADAPPFFAAPLQSPEDPSPETGEEPSRNEAPAEREERRVPLSKKPPQKTLHARSFLRLPSSWIQMKQAFLTDVHHHLVHPPFLPSTLLSYPLSPLYTEVVIVGLLSNLVDDEKTLAFPRLFLPFRVSRSMNTQLSRGGQVRPLPFVQHGIIEERLDAPFFTYDEAVPEGEELFAYLSPVHLLSQMCQVFFGLRCAQRELGFLHGDLHTGNVGVKSTHEQEILAMTLDAQKGGERIYVPTFGKQCVMVGFGQSSVAMEAIVSSSAVPQGGTHRQGHPPSSSSSKGKRTAHASRVPHTSRAFCGTRLSTFGNCTSSGIMRSPFQRNDRGALDATLFLLDCTWSLRNSFGNTEEEALRRFQKSSFLREYFRGRETFEECVRTKWDPIETFAQAEEIATLLLYALTVGLFCHTSEWREVVAHSSPSLSRRTAHAEGFMKVAFYDICDSFVTSPSPSPPLSQVQFLPSQSQVTPSVVLAVLQRFFDAFSKGCGKILVRAGASSSFKLSHRLSKEEVRVCHGSSHHTDQWLRH